MQKQLQQLIQTTLLNLQKQGKLPDGEIPINVEYSRNNQHGDFATNVAMLYAKILQQKPLTVAELIVSAIPQVSFLRQVKIAAPGFINFYLANEAFTEVVKNILEPGSRFANVANIGNGSLAIVEFVSANPTGPLHVGHGRGAAFGDTTANLLEAVGFKVHREYYLNDAGRQMHVLALSVWLRYLELAGDGAHFPLSGYKGEYVIDIARDLYNEYGKKLQRSIVDLYKDLPVDGDVGGDKEFYVDALCERARHLLGAQDYQLIFNAGLEAILADIKQDLEEFGVVFQEWFRESHLLKNGDVEDGIAKLKQNGHVYEKDGALWFEATKFGDEKDRVLKRANGQTTYFASDIGYHLNKYERGFDLIIDVFGSDHHGYAPRIKAFLQALDLDVNKLNILLVQFAILYRGKQKVSMSTRSGEFVTLRQLREEVGKDAARFFYIMRKNDQHLDFDLDLAKSQSLDNPVYYIQYAHARICSVMRQLQDKQLTYDETNGLANLSLLQSQYEKDVLCLLLRYPITLQQAALRYEPHLVANYLRELASGFHAYYNACQFLVDDSSLRDARLCLINAVKKVLLNGLELLGVSCPDSM